jgi:hypothetical protein
MFISYLKQHLEQIQTLPELVMVVVMAGVKLLRQLANLKWGVLALVDMLATVVLVVYL